MAGNPFRRSISANITIPPAASFNADDNTPSPTSAAQPKKKHVTILTPPALNEDEESDHRLSGANFAKSAAFPPHPTWESGAFDPLDDSVDSDLGEARLNTTSNTQSSAPPTAFPGIFDRQESGGGGAAMKAPYNPFARTLATTEAAYQTRDGTSTNGHDRAKTKDSPDRPAMMDVDAFKNMLLTGSAATPNTASVTTPATRTQHTTSDAETSSAFDTNYSSRGPLSPGMDGFDDYASASPTESDDDDDDHDFMNERKNLMGQGRSDDIAPPAPPKPARSTRGPQTVSFADFDQSIPHDWQAPNRGPSPLKGGQPAGILRPTVHRVPSDLNKPLPPAPSAGSGDSAESSMPPPSVPDKDPAVSPVHTQIPAVPQAEPQLEPEPESRLQPEYTPESSQLPQSEDTSQPKKRPPPPPVSRRQQSSNSTTRARSASNLSNSSSIRSISVNDPVPMSGTNPALSATVRSDSPTPKSTAAPLPPPSRKPRPTGSPSPRNSPSPQTQTSASENAAPFQPPKTVPPPPPRRLSSRTYDSSRTSSPAHSLRKTPSPAAPGSIAPPPPPPRRGIASSGYDRSPRSSLDSARRPGSFSSMTGDAPPRGSFDSGMRRRRESGASVAMVAEEDEENGGTGRDVLADMRAFEAEIEALRRREAGGV